MRVAHFDCFSGISGDMTLAALIDAGVDADSIRRGLASLGLPLTLKTTTKRRSGIAGTHVEIEYQDQATDRHLSEIEALIARSALTAAQKDLATRIFRRLGEAEARVHGIPLERVHFHEVGALDSIADIVGSAIGLDLLGVERFTARPVPPGSGTVKCEHGLMPVPAPATALLLQGVPLATVPVKGEMTTPTGAAILTTVVTEWTEQPAMTVTKVGHGAGTKDFPDWPNVLRLFIGEATVPPDSGESDTVWVLETNLDDVPAEVIGYCQERLFAAGALDVYCTPIAMKKNRPGVLLSVLAAAGRVAELEAILFRETATFGVRRYPAQRHKLRREAATVPTPWGPVRGKKGWRDGLTVFAPEFEECARVARENNVPLREVYDAVRRAAHG
ncbi:MAG: nickel pincer cofactor biosynthesis protein LarC [Gemmataceae bacterium]